MAEDKKKAVKKKVSKKKTAKKVTRKKIVKKAPSKKVTKKTEKRKTAKKILRKKAAQKKPIKLKADSPDLDSFASHAAENVEAIEAAAVSLEANTAASNADKTESSKKAAQTKRAAVKPAKAKVEKKSVTQGSSVAKTKPEEKKPVAVTHTPPRPSASSRSATSGSESFTSKLIIAAVLFLGVGIYLMTIPDAEVKNQTAAKPAELSEKENVKSQTTSDLTLELDSIAESSDTAPETAAKETPVFEFRPTEKAEQGSIATKDLSAAVKEKALEQALDEEAAKQPIAQIGVEQATEDLEKTHFPPPPTPDFLQKTATKPLPENQMEMIKELFAPELK